jgi:tRNA dimethylallyltransferase
MPDISRISREAPVLIAGPTACGKSALAMEIAARDGRMIVNADALQVYGCWRVLTARPSAEDEAALPHALYGHIARRAHYSTGEWLRQVTPLLEQPVVIVGGTGLNFSALTEGLADIPAIPPAVRAEANARVADAGYAPLLAELDADTAARIDQQNGARIQRAWEVWRATGRGLASWQAETPAPALALSSAEPLVIRPEVAWLDARIAQRFHAMIAGGALAEVEAAQHDWQPDLPSSRAIGAPEFIAYLQGKSTISDAISASILASRRYAKRQRTWFRSRMGAWREFSVLNG